MKKGYSEYKVWLQKEKGLGKHSAEDAVSRLRRAEGILEIGGKEDAEAVIYGLSREAGFKALNDSVKSQIRRAVKLFFEFSAGCGGPHTPRIKNF